MTKTKLLTLTSLTHHQPGVADNKNPGPVDVYAVKVLVNFRVEFVCSRFE